MNFFEQQRVAKKQTIELTIHFLIAVVFIIFISNFLLFTVFKYYIGEHDTFDSNRTEILYFFTFIQLLLIFGGIAYKTVELSSGGSSIAKLLGGFPLEKTTRELDQKKLVNIVDEMAVASGVAAPPIYLLEGELSINALVAGFDSSSAVLAVTEGAIRHLDRDELQALIAHEFSHIFNGDMRFNTYLIGVLHGIQMISVLGSSLMEMRQVKGRGSSSYYGDKDDAQFIGKSWVLGFCLYAIGFLGLIIARAIKKEINKQREFLADSTSVQYTRNGTALFSVFKKIMANDKNQFFVCGKQDVVGHMCFTEITFRGKSYGVGSHPELTERVMRIMPSFDLESFKRDEIEKIVNKIDKSNRERMPIHQSLRKKILEELEVEDIENSLSIGASIIMGMQVAEIAKDSVIKDKVKSSLGVFNDKSLSYAREQIKKIPSELIETIHNPGTSNIAILTLFSIISGAPYETLGIKDPKVNKMMGLLGEKIKLLDRSLYLPMIEISLSSLSAMNSKEIESFLSKLKSMIKDDKKINIQEFLYYTIISKGLRSKPKLINLPARAKNLKKEYSILLSLIAHAGFPEDPEGAEKAFSRINGAYFKSEIKLLKVNELRISSLKDAFLNLNNLKIEDREELLKASIDMAKFGGNIIPLELEIIRAISSVLGVPLPLVI